MSGLLAPVLISVTVVISAFVAEFNPDAILLGISLLLGAWGLFLLFRPRNRHFGAGLVLGSVAAITVYWVLLFAFWAFVVGE